MAFRLTYSLTPIDNVGVNMKGLESLLDILVAMIELIPITAVIVTITAVIAIPLGKIQVVVRRKK